MNIIKLNAIDSTNDYIKELIQNQFLENYTIVCAKKQTNGKGQMGAIWESEEGKNLTFSILIKDLLLDLNDIFNLNIMIAVSIFQVLTQHKIKHLSIKWANDILAGKKKIGGILIENVIKSNKEIHSIIGIGINVNQENFAHLPQASSLKCITQKEFNLDELLVDICQQVILNSKNFDSIGQNKYRKIYIENLFAIHKPMTFQFEDQNFMGIIRNVTDDGLIQIEHENDLIKTYGIKEIKMLY